MDNYLVVRAGFAPFECLPLLEILGILQVTPELGAIISERSGGQETLLLYTGISPSVVRPDVIA